MEQVPRMPPEQGCGGWPSRSPPPKSRSGIQVPALVVLAIFPFLLGLAGTAILESGAADQARVTAESRLDVLISQIEAGKSPHEHFSRLFQRLEQRVFLASEPLKIWGRAVAALKARYPGQIQVVLLDGEGIPVPGWLEKPTARSLSRKFLHAYRRFVREKEPLPSVVQSFIKSYFGTFMPQGSVIHGRLFFANAPPRLGYVFLSAPKDQGMFFIFFVPRTPLQTLALEEEIASVTGKPGGGRLALAITGQRGSAVWERLGRPISDFRQDWRDLHRSPQARIWRGSTLIARRLLFPGVWVVGTLDLAPSRITPEQFRVGFLAVMVAVLLFLQPGPVATFVELLASSVRLKLLIAFLYSSAVPLLIMGLTARSYLTDRRGVLEAGSHQQMEQTLMDFDRRFQLHLGELESRLRHIYHARPVPPPDGFRDFLAREEELRTSFGFDSCRVYDRTGALVHQYDDPLAAAMSWGQAQGLSRMVRQFFLQVEDEARSAGLGEAVSPARKSDEFADTSINLDLLFFNELDSGGVRFFLFCCPLGTADNRFTHVAFMVWNSNRMEINYLRAELGKLSRRAGRGEYFAWDPLKPGLEVPPDFGHRRLIAPAMPKVTSRTRSYRAALTGARGGFLLTGLRGTSLKSISLIGMVSNQGIQAEINDLRWSFGFITLVIMGASIIIGTLLSGFFLVPLADLTRGMNAIAERRFDARIPVKSEDELGGLGNLFNEALGNLQDLEVARTVQDYLFPKEALLADGWEILGGCLPASQVGGDFFDFTRMGDGSVRLALGDVSGHGVGAALVVALVKSALGHPSTPQSPIGALSCLHGMIVPILHRKKAVSCNLARFEPATGELVLANAGQTYPVLVREGRASFLEARGYPLGSVRVWKADSQEVRLRRGDAVVLYTDGLVEAPDGTGAPIGFDRLLEALPGLIGPTAIETLTAIRAWHQVLSPGSPPADDVTLLVLQSRPEA